MDGSEETYKLPVAGERGAGIRHDANTHTHVIIIAMASNPIEMASNLL